MFWSWLLTTFQNTQITCGLKQAPFPAQLTSVTSDMPPDFCKMLLAVHALTECNCHPYLVLGKQYLMLSNKENLPFRNLAKLVESDGKAAISAAKIHPYTINFNSGCFPLSKLDRPLFPRAHCPSLLLIKHPQL